MRNLRLSLCVALCILSSFSAVLASEAKTALDAYISNGIPGSLGACDNGMSTLVVFTGPDFKEMVFFAPVSSLETSYFVVTQLDGKKEYFIRVAGSDEVTVRSLPMMQWSREVMRESMNFFRYLFLPDKPHDCGTGILKQD